jgi:hypothetical protein
MRARRFVSYVICVMGLVAGSEKALPQQTGQRGQRVQERDLLYVAVPNRAGGTEFMGEYGGVGVLVFDARSNYRFVKRIPTWNYPASQEPEAMRGIAASISAGLLYISTPTRLAAISLTTDKMVWEQTYDGECCDRMAVSPDGKMIYAPGDGGSSWYVIDAMTGNLIKKIATPESNGAHNTIWSLDGSRVFMSGQQSPVISVADPKTHTVVQTVGPFSNVVRPFTVNGKNTYLFANVNDLLGFEVADLKTGKMIHRVVVDGYGWSRARRLPHQVPSHGIALSPDEKEIWVVDGVNLYVHVFDSTVMPPKQTRSIRTRDVPAWLTFGLDGKFVYPSSGDVINAATKEIVAGLKDEFGNQVRSEKLVEVLFANGKPVRTVDQFGVGLVRN